MQRRPNSGVIIGIAKRFIPIADFKNELNDTAGSPTQIRDD
jgi:hypothetical protein